MAELFVIIVCGSVPPLKPIYDHYIRKPKVRVEPAGYHEYAISNTSKRKLHSPYGSPSDGFADSGAREKRGFDMENGPLELPGEEPYKPKKEHPAGDITVPMPPQPPLKSAPVGNWI
jgi:hypothetical protein